MSDNVAVLLAIERESTRKDSCGSGARRTGFVSAERLEEVHLKISFKDKKENINGLQLADLVAYPIARYVIEPKRANPAFEKLEQKIYKKNGKRYGLKIFP